MYIVYVWEDLQWKLESMHSTAADAELQRIESCLLDDRERDIKKVGF